MEVYVCRIQITNSLMRPFIVPVTDELLMRGKHPSLADVRLMERLNLTNRRRSPYACDDMLYPISSAELRELRPGTPSRIELRSTIRQDLVRFAKLPDRDMCELIEAVCVKRVWRPHRRESTTRRGRPEIRSDALQFPFQSCTKRSYTPRNFTSQAR